MEDYQKSAASIPAISVVMPTYNDGLYLREAIDSILNQTFTDFEFIIVNDGSTDETEEIILRYPDKRIKYFKNDSNMGSNYSRSRGMRLAVGKYIAAMDSDDYVSDNRLMLQYHYLESNADIGLLGGDIVFFDKNTWFCKRYSTNPDYLKSLLFFRNAVGSATIMMRHSLVKMHELFYNPEFENGGDYELFFRTVMAGIKIGGIRKVIYYYRQSDNQLSSPHNQAPRKKNIKKYLEAKLKLCDIRLNEPDFLIFHDFVTGRVEVSKKSFELINQVFNRIEDFNLQMSLFDKDSFKAVLFGYRLRLLKYYYLENQKYILFILKFLSLSWYTGAGRILLFWTNEGRYIRSKGHSGKLVRW